MLTDYITGDKSRLPFDVLLSLRSQFIRRPAPTFLAMLAVAASVALAASVEVSSRSVSTALARSMNAIAGSTQLEVTAAGQGVPEEMIDLVRDVPGVRSASPIIPETFRLVRDDGQEESLRVLGIDLLYDREVRDYGVAQGGFRVHDHVRLVASRDSVVLSERLAQRLGVGEGAKLRLRATNGMHTVTVRGLLLGDLAAAYGGSFAVMDVYALQHTIGIGPIVSRIDVSAEDGQDLDTVRAAIQERVGDAVSVRRSTLRENLVTPILAAYSFGVWAITLIGVLLALFLTYAAISVVVDRRIVEFALLRAAGMDADRAARAVVVDALVLATAGTALGFAAAVHFAGSLVVFFSRATAFYQDLAVEPAPMSIQTVAIALAAGIPTALVACLEPALRVRRSQPLDVLHGRSGAKPRVRRVPRLLVFGIVASCLFIGSIAVTGLPPAARLGSAVGFGVLAVWSLTSVLLPVALPRLQVALASVVPRVGVLVGASLGDRPVETGVTVAIWATVIAAAFGLLTSLRTLGTSMDDFFVGELGPDAIVVYGEDPATTAQGGRLLIDPSMVEAIKRTPGVSDAWAVHSTTVIVRGEEVPLEEYEPDKMERHGGLRAISRDSEASVAALRRGELLASDAFRSRYGVQVGDSIEIKTAEGMHTFKVGGESRSFRGPRGMLHISAAGFDQWFRAPGAEMIVFWADGPVEQVLANVRAAAGQQPVFFRQGDLFRRQARRVIGRFSALLTAPLLVVASIGLVGLANLLVGNVAARRRELALMRAAGATSGNVLAVVVLSAALIALIGTAAGMVLGLAWELVIRDAIGHFLGWTMSLTIAWGVVGSLIIGAAGAAAMAAAVPALLTMRSLPGLAPGGD